MILNKESLALAVSKPSPLLPPCSHGCQSEGILQDVADGARQINGSSKALTVMKTHFSWEGDLL